MPKKVYATSLNVTFISDIIICKNKINNVTGTENSKIYFIIFSGITETKKIMTVLKYITHFIGLHTFDTTSIYSYIQIIATIIKAKSIIGAVPKAIIKTTNGKPINDVKILFKFIIISSICTKFSRTFLVF